MAARVIGLTMIKDNRRTGNQRGIVDGLLRTENNYRLISIDIHSETRDVISRHDLFYIRFLILRLH